MAIKKKAIAPTPVIITDPKEAVQVLQRFMRESNFSPFQINGSRARYARVSQIVDWGLANGIAYDKGWLGRSLNAAAKAGMRVTAMTATGSDGERFTIYRNSR